MLCLSLHLCSSKLLIARSRKELITCLLGRTYCEHQFFMLILARNYFKNSSDKFLHAYRENFIQSYPHVLSKKECIFKRAFPTISENVNFTEEAVRILSLWSNQDINFDLKTLQILGVTIHIKQRWVGES